MDKIKFWTFDELADYNYGVKEFEIRFQHMIEDYLKANGDQLVSSRHTK